MLVKCKTSRGGKSNLSGGGDHIQILLIDVSARVIL